MHADGTNTSGASANTHHQGENSPILRIQPISDRALKGLLLLLGEQARPIHVGRVSSGDKDKVNFFLGGGVATGSKRAKPLAPPPFLIFLFILSLPFLLSHTIHRIYTAPRRLELRPDEADSS